MPRMRAARLLQSALIACLGLAGMPGWSAAQAPANAFLAEKPACFGRVYDKAHLARRTLQKVTSIHVWRAVEDRKEAENYRPQSQKEQPAHEFGVDAYVTFRDRRGQFHNSLWCGHREGSKDLFCGIECDGGSFVLAPDGAGSVLLRNNGFVLIGGCGSDVEDDKRVYFSPGADDKVFRLEKKDPSVCRAEEQKAKPLRLGYGKPLRERFGAEEAFCFGRDYDAAHLAKNPQQKVSSIRVGRLDPASEREPAQAADPDYAFPLGVKLSVALRLKGGGAARSVRYDCNPTEASWECVIAGKEGVHTTCDDATVHLARGPGEDVFLINRKDGLPIERACQPRRPEVENVRRDTRSDDRTFRLTRMPLEACR
jgi:hypothetical protein